MLKSLDIRHWFVIAVLVLVNVLLFGCVLLVWMGKIAIF